MKFLGVRGSTPSPGEATSGYGGNTSCVGVLPDDAPPMVLDLGTGLRRLSEGPMRAIALVTHLHFDHVQGLPFCAGLLHHGAQIDIYGPPQEQGSLRDAFEQFVRPPLFPVQLDHLPGEYRFHEVDEERFEVAPGVEVEARRVPHPGPTNGYRIECDGASLAYIPDHQEPTDPLDVAPGVLELAREVDLLIHDAQYTPEEFARKSDWGHCTVEFAVGVALQARARRLALFHHDPSHSDGLIDVMVSGARECAARFGSLDVFAAREGAEVAVAGAATERALRSA
ncbi:MAG: MBL fold metallo-hydrolase [Actinomycetota bacterium]